MYTFDDTGFTKTERLEHRSSEILETLRTGNVWRYGNAISFSLGVLGLLLGNVALSPLVLLLLASNIFGSVVGYFSYCLDEGEQLGISPSLIPLVGGEEEVTLASLMTEKERLHYQAIRFMGINNVKTIEQSGGLDILLEQIEDLADTPGAENPVTYAKLMREIKQSIIVEPTSNPRIGEIAKPRRALDTADLAENPWDSDRPSLPVATAASSFDWATITRRPHLFILGDTGSGKTALTQWLLATHYPKGSQVLVLDPHDRKGQWGNHPTIGRGRNFPAIELALENLVREMDDRYSSGDYNHQPQIVVIEEMPAIAANCKTATASIACLTLEARKVGIFLIVLSQGWEVDSIGIKGKGSIRKSFLFICLGEFALEKAKQLDINLWQKVKECDRPCLVGDELAIIPDFSQPQKQPSLSDLRQQLEFCLDAKPPAPEPTKRQFTPTPKPALVSPLKEIFEYARTQETEVKARDIKGNVASCKKLSPDEIRGYFLELEEMEYGYTEGEGIFLSFGVYS